MGYVPQYGETAHKRVHYYCYYFPQHASSSFLTDLGSADVAGGLVAADVLLSGLQCQSVRRPPPCVPCHSHHPAWNCAQEVLPAGKESSMGSPIAQWYAKALVGADGNVHAYVTGRLEDGHSQKVCGAHHQCLRDGRSSRKLQY